MTITATTMRLAARLGYGLDVFFSGVWEWQCRRWFAERHLAKVLNRYGDQSIEARRTTEKYRDIEFAAIYWRPTPRPVQQIVRAAAAAGVPIDALRLVVLSRDLRIKGSDIVLRRSRLIAALSMAMATIVLFEWADLCAITLLHHGHIALKCSVLVIVTAINAVLWRGWTLWCGRPEAVVRRWAAVLEQSREHVARGSVTQLTPHASSEQS